jgi:hypothetical protein
MGYKLEVMDSWHVNYKEMEMMDCQLEEVDS